MPRVVPSQVVALIDQMFPEKNGQRGLHLNMANKKQAQLAALVNLVDQIPPELFTLDADHHHRLVVAIAEIERALSISPRSYTLQGIPEFDNCDPITLIHQALSACPDEFPSPATTELNFIADQQLRDNLRMDISATNSALGNGEWKSATVLAGSVVEALLLWALQQRPQTDISTAVGKLVGNNILRANPGSQLENWTLVSYIEVSLGLNVIDADTATQARLAKDFRNLIHPGRSMRLGQICDRATALSAVAAVEHVVRCLTP